MRSWGDVISNYLNVQLFVFTDIGGDLQAAFGAAARLFGRAVRSVAIVRLRQREDKQ